MRVYTLAVGWVLTQAQLKLALTATRHTIFVATGILGRMPADSYLQSLAGVLRPGDQLVGSTGYDVARRLITILATATLAVSAAGLAAYTVHREVIIGGGDDAMLEWLRSVSPPELNGYPPVRLGWLLQGRVSRRRVDAGGTQFRSNFCVETAGGTVYLTAVLDRGEAGVWQVIGTRTPDQRWWPPICFWH